jgi:hypothetical protein
MERFCRRFLKGESHLTQVPKSIIDSDRSVRHGVKQVTPSYINASAISEDKNKLDVSKRIIEGKIKMVECHILGNTSISHRN